MNDTTPEMHKFQYDLIMSKTPEERLIMCFEMMEAGRLLMIAGIKAQNPDLSDDEIRIEILKRMRLHDDSLSWLDEEILKK